MMSWIVIVVLVIAGIIAIRLNHLRHRFFIVLIILLALFLYTTMTMVSEVNEFELNSADGVVDALKVYLGWLANGFNNLKELTGKAIKMDWKSTNNSFFENAKEDKKIRRN